MGTDVVRPRVRLVRLAPRWQRTPGTKSGRRQIAVRDRSPSERTSEPEGLRERHGRDDVIVDPHRGMGADRVDGEPCRRVGPDPVVQQPEPHGSDRDASFAGRGLDRSGHRSGTYRTIRGRNSRRPSSGPTTRRSARADSSGRSPDPRRAESRPWQLPGLRAGAYEGTSTTRKADL